MVSNFRRMFLRGLGVLLPSVLTIWILIAAYGFVQEKIARPINAGGRELVLRLSSWPVPMEEDVEAYETAVRADPKRHAAWKAAGGERPWLRLGTRREQLEQWWQQYPFPMDLIGLAIAVVLIYIVGALLGSFIGNRLLRRGERLIQRVPLVKQVYPHVKQVTDFLVGDGSGEKFNFNRVVAVEYPRKGLWSVGLVTGDTMRLINERANQTCLTVFIPSSPTPFTGYVITVPRNDTIDLPVTIDEALKFTISGGVIVPAGQKVTQPQPEASGGSLSADTLG